MSEIKPSEKHVESTLKEEPKLYTLEEIAKSIMEFGICPINTPIQHGGLTLNCAKRVRKALVKDRIEAVRFSKEQYGFEFNDAITAHLGSSILVFGELADEQRDERDNLTQLTMKGEVVIAVDMLINTPYEDLINLAHLMGKS